MSFALDETVYRGLVHVRHLTPQRGPSTDHGRPGGEWHVQMIFDGDRRGSGSRNFLRTRDYYPTVLLGFRLFQDRPLIVAWDPSDKSEYGYSRSLQIREATLIEAAATGIGLALASSGDVVVAFRMEFLPEYLRDMAVLHSLSTLGSYEESTVREASDRNLQPGSGTRIHESVGRVDSRPVRDIRFIATITDCYPACAICGAQTPAMLDAARISLTGDDTSADPSNGLRLCRNCHRLFDAGLLLIRPDHVIEVAPEFAVESPRDAELYGRPECQRLRAPALTSRCQPDSERLRLVYERNRPTAQPSFL